MDLQLQPKPILKIGPADKGIVSRKEFFVKKVPEEISKYPFPALLIREWKPKPKLIYPSIPDESRIRYECDINRNCQSPFVEDDSEEVFLLTPPPCFVILGKDTHHIDELASKISEKYGSVLINIKNIVSEFIGDENSVVGKFLDKVLRTGSAVTFNFLLALASCQAHSAKARHRGYVLTGLPCLPHFYDIPAEQQINFLFSWDVKPTIFIEVGLEDDEVFERRSSLRYEFLKLEDERDIVLRTRLEKKAFNERNVIHENDDFRNTSEIFPHENFENEEENIEEDEDVENENEEVSREWIRFPKDEENRIWRELELFESDIKPVIDLFRCRIDPLYFISVDPRVGNESEIVFARLETLGVCKPPEAVPFIPLEPEVSKGSFAESVSEEEEPEEEIHQDDLKNSIIDDPPETAFLKLLNKRVLTPKFLWELSHYNYVCPVSLRSGEIVQGKSEFAVMFMKYIYFLKDKVSLLRFIENPRCYVLPVRPKPPFRFIILGYPFCGKTTLAKSLAHEYSLPLLDLNTILKNDREKKKETYKEFCQEKAKKREIIRLTKDAWKRWRMEEERRVTLIEEWIEYIQNLLRQRTNQIYAMDTGDKSSLDDETQIRSHLPDGHPISKSESEGSQKLDDRELEVRGVRISPEDISSTYSGEYIPSDNQSSPSEKLVQAFKHENFNFNKDSLEVDANLFFSSLWSSFSHEVPKKSQEEGIEEEEFGEHTSTSESIPSERSIDWTHLLPPQSLSSFLIDKNAKIIRDKHKAFRYLLEAASKVSWIPSELRKEFAKWHLPCFMDIPLCEKYHDNPLLLLRYCPLWLRERPKVPEAIDESHHFVKEAGRRAYELADIVTVNQNKNEIVALLTQAMEKAEREGMRWFGEIPYPGGWVLDNMITDSETWKILAQKITLPDFIYFMVDPEPECPRLLKRWWEANLEKEKEEEEEEEEQEGETSIDDEYKDYEDKRHSKDLSSYKSLLDGSLSQIQMDSHENMMKSLMQGLESVIQGDRELDDIFENILNEIEDRYYIVQFLKDLGSHSVLQMTFAAWHEMEEFGDTESLSSNQHTYFSTDYYPLGPQLTKFSTCLLALANEVDDLSEEKKLKQKESCESLIRFYFSILTKRLELEKLKTWLGSVDKESAIREIDVSGKNAEEVFREVLLDLKAPFMKKPRELEEFEKIELEKCFAEEEIVVPSEEEFEVKSFAEKEDMRIYGEAGPFCVVHLDKSILLKGKIDIVLRYNGRLYFFWDQNAKEEFIKDPEKYAPFYSAIRCLPPLKIWLLGPMGAGKSTLAGLLSRQFGLHHVDHIEFINGKLIPNADVVCGPFTPLHEKKLYISDEHNDEARNAIYNFSNLSHSKQKYLLENPPFYTDIEEEQHEILMSLTNFAKKSDVISYQELTYQSLSERSPSSEIELEGYRHYNFADSEEIVKNYVHEGSTMPDYFIEKSTKLLWADEPYTLNGFIADGFPFKSCDVEYLKANNWLPDLIIELELSATSAVDRLSVEKMKLWELKLEEEMEEHKRLEDTLQAIRNVFIRNRRKSLLREKRISYFMEESEGKVEAKHVDFQESFRSVAEDKGTKEKKKAPELTFSSTLYEVKEFPAGGSFDFDAKIPPEDELLISAEIEEIIQQEYPEMVFQPIFEEYDDAKERFEANILVNYNKDFAEIEKIKQDIEGLGIEKLTIDSEEDLEKTKMELLRQLHPLKKRIYQRCEHAFSVDVNTAEKLLEQGYYYLSKFGRWCPVQIYNMKNPVQMFRPLKLKGKIFPIVYRNYIYFIGGENEKNKFISDPIRYTFNEPHHPNLPLRIAVVGPPKSGKSLLSQRLGSTFGLKVITMGDAIRFVVQQMPESLLAKKMEQYLRLGIFLPLNLKIEAVFASLNDPKCVTQGFVFDGIPYEDAMAESFAERGMFPFVILSLTGDAQMGRKHRKKLDVGTLRLPFKQRTDLNRIYDEWDLSYGKFVKWNQDTYNNLYEIPADLNPSDIFYRASEIVSKSFFSILYYVEYCTSHRPLPLGYMCIDLHEYETRKSVFKNICPGCWAEFERFNAESDPPPRSGLVQYENHIYWLCPLHVEEFLKRPKKFIPEEIPLLFAEFPKRLDRECSENREEFNVYGNGRCPVTKRDFPGALDWVGSWDFAVSYENQVYLMRDEEMLKRFMAKPWRYSKIDMVFEVDSAESHAVERLGPPKVTSLPPMGFLEQTVAKLVQNGLSILGKVRPIYPNMSPTTTAVAFVALFLRAHCETNKTPGIEKSYLDFMFIHCKAGNYIRAHQEKPERQELGQGDCEIEHIKDHMSEESDDEESGSHKLYKPSQQTVETVDSPEVSYDSFKAEIEAQPEKSIWSAKYVDPKVSTMLLTANLELMEIPEFPKYKVHLKYQTYGLRVNPLPPLTNCLNFVYSIREPLKLPDEFDYRTLYQPSPLFTSPFPQDIIFNPNKEFPQKLFKETEPADQSVFHMYQGGRTQASQSTIDDKDQKLDPDLFFMLENFLPRFQILDAMPHIGLPGLPRVVDEKFIIFNPQRDYTYTLLFAYFFGQTHIKRSLASSEIHDVFEYKSILSRKSKIYDPDFDFLRRPRFTNSMKSLSAIHSYQQIFEAACTFFVEETVNVSESNGDTSQISSNLKIEVQDFEEVVLDVLPDESYFGAFETEFSYSSSDSEYGYKPSVVFREVLPFPPLPWDVTCLPYYSYRTIYGIFQPFKMDEIVHERHVSLLDGIVGPYEEFRFVHYPTWVEKRSARKSEADVSFLEKLESIPKFYPVFEFLDLSWSAFMVYPFSWAFNCDLKDNFSGEHSEYTGHCMLQN